MFDPFTLDITDVLDGIPPIQLINAALNNIENHDIPPSVSRVAGIAHLAMARQYLATAYRSEELECETDEPLPIEENCE